MKKSNLYDWCIENNKEYLIKEWDKNNEKDIRSFTYGSKEKARWICPKGHEYEQIISKRTTRGFNCPFCSGHGVLKGFNDLATLYPKLAKEWHPTKNKLSPSNYTRGSGKRVWWLCPKGHEYEAVIRDRTSGTNCPICNLRKQTSFPEQALYYYFKKAYPDAISKYKDIFKQTMELDIYIPSIKTGIEYDGKIWHEGKEIINREKKKYKICKENGIRLIRVREKNDWLDGIINSDITYYVNKPKNKKELEKLIQNVLDETTFKFSYEKDRIIVDLNKDYNEIISYLTSIENSLLNKRPDVAKKWNYNKNGNLKPEMFTVSSNEVVWWLCPDCGHEWKSSINGMTRKGRKGCPVCSKVSQGKNFTKNVINNRGSLADNYPELIKEWNTTKNGSLTPYDVASKSNKNIWWICAKCGYERETTPNNKTKGSGCPKCKKRKK